MDRIEKTVALVVAIESADWFQVEALTTEDFRYYDVTPDPIDKETWLAFLVAIKSAIPDLSLELKHMKQVGEEIHFSLQVDGHHTQPLQLPLANTRTLPATLTHVHLPLETVIVKFDNDQISEVRAKYRLHTGLIGLLEQLGVT